MRKVLVPAVMMTAALWPSPSHGQGLGPRTLLPIHVLCAELPVASAPVATLTIAGIQKPDSRVSVAPGEIAVIGAGTGQGLAVGQRFVARRVRTGTYEGMRTREEGWTAIHTAGVVSVIAVDNQFALARVDEACDTVDVGDYLEPLAIPTLPVPGAAGAANFDDRARVLFGRDRREMFADGDILSFDRGTAHGVAAGARIAIFRDKLTGLPLVEVGEAVVLDASADTSRAVVVRSHDFVVAGDVVVVRSNQP